MGKKVKKQVHKIDIGVVDRPWKFSKNLREEGLFRLLTAAPLKYKNITEEEYRKYKMLVDIENKKKQLEK